MNRIVFFILWIASASLHSAPWIGTDDALLRSDIEFLADSKLISVPITTWPLMWSGIIRDLEKVETHQLSPFEFQAYRRVRSAFKADARRGTQPYFALRAANAEKEFMHFGDVQRERLEATLGSDWLGERFALRVRATYVDDPFDKKEKRFDGSFLSGALGNWSLTAGAIPYWWGPAWDSSLILSNNARPIPAVTLQRNDSKPFEWPVLNWIGPWHLVTFMGKLENNRIIPESLLFGLRASFKPISSLELAGSRVIHWGGEKRDNSIGQWLGAVISKADERHTKENVNSLAGIDFRWGNSLWKHPVSLYGHYMIEDGANPRRGKYFWMAGGSIQGFSILGQPLSVWAEYADTMAHKAGTRLRRADTAYEGGLYQHRSRQRSIGSTYDNDSEITAVGLLFHFKNTHQALLQMRHLNLNRDNSAGGNKIASRAQNLYEGVFTYQAPLSIGYLRFNMQYQTEELTGILNNKKKWLIGFEFSKAV